MEGVGGWVGGRGKEKNVTPRVSDILRLLDGTRLGLPDHLLTF